MSPESREEHKLVTVGRKRRKSAPQRGVLRSVSQRLVNGTGIYERI